MNISIFKNCYGCGVCVISSPRKIIDMRLSKDGFYKPEITDHNKCNDCGICLDVCAFNHKDLANSLNIDKLKSYGCWSKNDNIRHECTTAGLGYEIAYSIIKNGGKACVVKYNVSEHRAEHYVASNITDLEASKGSKYIPSYTLPGFSQICREKGKCLVVGLPCQIDSFRRYVRRYKQEDRYIMVDLLCHGVPSLILWRRYLSNVEKSVGEIKEVKFRSKHFGWHRSACMELCGDKKNLIQEARDNLFYKLFFLDICLNKCCHGDCKYKLFSSSADIRIGDFWGDKYKHVDSGVNVIMSFTDKGDDVIEGLKDRCEFEPVSIQEACDKQMRSNAPAHKLLRGTVLWGIKHNIPLWLVYDIAYFCTRLMSPVETFRKVKLRLSKIIH